MSSERDLLWQSGEVDPWNIGLVVVLVLGVVVILAGALIDRRRNRRAREEMLSPPKRVIPQFRPDTPAPEYLSELQARRPVPGATSTLSRTEREAVRAALTADDTVTIKVGYAATGFVTDPETGWAVLDQPVVLLCTDRVGSIRELLPVLERAALSRRSLVVAAPDIAADVVATLEVNVIQQKLRLLAVIVGAAGLLERIAVATGGVPVARSDLQAGYLERGHLGSCARWVSTKEASYLLSSGASEDPAE